MRLGLPFGPLLAAGVIAGSALDAGSSAGVAVSEEGGFNPLDTVLLSNAFWTWVIFLAALPFMWKIVFGPIAKALVERDERAENAIRKADEAATAAEEARASTESQLATAREEAQRQIREARERAEAQARELLDQARRDADQDRTRALAEIEAEKFRAMGEIRDSVVDISLGAASKLIGREFSDADQRGLVESFVEASGTHEG